MTIERSDLLAQAGSSLLGNRSDRRAFLRRGVALGMTLPVASVLLAACGGDDDDDEEEAVQEPDPTEPPADSDEEDEEEPESEPEEPEPEVDEEQGSEPSDETAQEGDLPISGEPERPQTEDMAYGFNIAWRADEEGEQFNADTRRAVELAGFNWIRFQVHWREVQREPDWYDPLPIDRLIELYDGSGIRIMISIVGAPDWARHPEGTQLLENYEHFAEFMTFMADRYRERVHAWEIWNEQNMAHEMQGEVRVSDYAYLLEAGYNGVKNADPAALVLFGGLTPTGINDPAVAINDVDYLREFYSFEGGAFISYFDAMGAHLNATNNPPDTFWPDNPGPGEWTEDNSFYFLRGRDLRNVMEEFGDGRPMWVTEFGWTTENMAPGYEYGADNSEEDQANYLVAAFDVAREQMPWISGMVVWNLNFAIMSPPEDEKYPWAVLNDDWSPRPAYTALQQMPKP